MMNLTNEQVNELDKMIRGIAGAKKSHYTIPYDDMVQSLWLMTLEIVNKKGVIDFNYIAASCYKHIKEVAAKSIRTEFLSYDTTVMNSMVQSYEKPASKGGTDNSTELITYQYSSCAKLEKIGERLEFDEMIDAMIEEFGIDSNEFKLVQSWLEILGISDEGEIEELPERAFDNFIAKNILGYAGSYSSAYSRVRKNVRRFFEEYGVADKYVVSCANKSRRNSMKRRNSAGC